MPVKKRIQIPRAFVGITARLPFFNQQSICSPKGAQPNDGLLVASTALISYAPNLNTHAWERNYKPRTAQSIPALGDMQTRFLATSSALTLAWKPRYK